MPRGSNQGGHRRGGGNKPGYDIDRLRPAVPAPTNGKLLRRDALERAEVTTPLDPTLTLSQLPLPVASALRLLARGYSDAQVEERMTVSKSIVAMWHDRYQLAGTEASQELADPNTAFRPFLEDALRTIHEIMLDGDARNADRLHAADSVVDRTYGKAPVQQPTAGLPNLVINIYDRAETDQAQHVDVHVIEGASGEPE